MSHPLDIANSKMNIPSGGISRWIQNDMISKNDEVVLPSFTIISCLSSVLRTGAKPVFCDVDEDSWNMTLENVEKAITSKTKAVMMVHLYGLSGEAEKIKDLCKQKNIFLIEF